MNERTQVILNGFYHVRLRTHPFQAKILPIQSMVPLAGNELVANGQYAGKFHKSFLLQEKSYY